MRLKNKVAIVTGAGKGIGRATALLFAREGARVALNDLTLDLVRETGRLVAEQGGDAMLVAGNVANATDVQALVQATLRRYGRIDVLYNNAGICRAADVPELTEEDWDQVIDVNVKGTFLCCKYVIPEMIKTRGGSIINLGSVASFVSLDGPQRLAPAYVASKGAVLQLTKALAVRHGRDNIRVNCLCPGFVDTDMVDISLAEMADSPQEKQELREACEASHALGRFGKPEEIADAALFLASEESSFVTGSPLHVDGGYLAR
jgi:NAD(P)-dependent dehydrogenase (short-subunit alcohol dehydrogenase family)